MSDTELEIKFKDETEQYTYLANLKWENKRTVYFSTPQINDYKATLKLTKK